MTALSLRLTHGANAVSLLHGHTANQTWQGVSPHEILGITNGVHTPTWVGQPMRDALERYTNADLDTMDDQPAARRFWERIGKVPAAELWEAHQRQKLELAIFARGRLRNQFARHGEAPTTLEELEDVLDPSILTIGFARRFATYKRADLIFTDLDRLARILWDEDRPMQVIFAGKAHPADRPGQGVIQDIFGRSRSPKLRGRVFILEDYDIRIARFLVQGVDVWLNNPRRPLEASGTSGMKAASNGVVNMSVLDGWWDEGWTGDNGWAIGGRETNPDDGAQDWADAHDLYRILEEELIPSYYERDANGLPARWIQLMRNSIASTIWRFSTTRMLHEYVERLYLPAAAVEPGRQARAPRHRGRGPLTPRSERRGPPDLARPRDPQPPAGRQLRLGVRRGVRAAPTCRCSRRSSATRACGCRSTTRGRSSSGSRAERPEFLDRLRALVARGQVELLGGGLYEPILASLPEHDRIEQLTRMAAAIEAIAGTRPQGAWLAERVWEPDLPTSLEAAGYRWTILDDQHFRAAAIREENLWGAYTTEDQGHLLTVFGTEQGLRYRIPFGSVEDVIGYLREHATEGGERVGMMGDDGEKFGAWPTTFEHCWGEGRWVERFFEALEANAGWLGTVTPSQWLEHEPPIGRVYLPTSSYAEMGEWALPPDETAVFAPLLHRAVAEHRPEARWLRGGFWRNFQVKYREINDLHKQMLRTSRKVAAMPAGPARDAALDHLQRGQSNDCYWHGLFGGIYISHMRLATYEHLIAAEDAADDALGSSRAAELRRPRHGRPAGRPPRRARAGRGRQAVGGRRDRLVGHPRGPARARGGAAPAARGLPRDAARPRGEGRGRRRRARGAGRPVLDPRPRQGQGGGPVGAPVLRRPRTTLRARAVPRAGHDPRRLRDGRGDGARRPPGRRVRRGPPRARPGLALAERDRWRASRSPSASRSASSAGASTRSWSSTSRSTTGATRRSTPASAWSCRSTCWAAAATRPPGTTSAAREPRTTAPARHGRSGRSATGTTGSGSRSGRPRSRPPTPGGARSRPCRTRSRASSASTRAAPCCSRGPYGSSRARRAGSPSGSR